MIRFGRKASLLTAAAMAMAVAACDDDRRTIDAPPPAPLAELEGFSDLPYAEPAEVQYYEAERAYPYAERAYGVQRAFYDAPPDYGFAYDDVSPYVWESSDDWALYAEPWDGDYRYYYYEPGAAYPYFVRDHDYGYAYSPTGILIAMFYPDGRYVPVDVAYRTAPLAGRYYARGHDLRRASRAARRIAVDDRVWVAEAPRISRSADPWLRAARDDKTWRAWRERDGDRELRRFDVETRRRQDAGAAWRERTARQKVATIERREDRLEAQALRGRREAVRDDRRDAQAARRVEVERRQAEQAGRREDAGRRQNEQRQAQAAAERNRQARDASQRQAAVARERQPKPAQAEARPPRPQAEPPRQAHREQPKPQQARAPSAAERGRPAAANEGGGKDRGRGKDERRKD